MKKIIINFVVMFMVSVSFTYAQSPFLTYRFANPTVIPGSPDTLMFDVDIKCDVPGTYHTDLSVYLNYNQDAFGEYVAGNGKISLIRGGLTNEEALFPGSGIFKYTLFPIVDNAPNRVAFATEPFLGYHNLSYLTVVPTTFTTYMKVKLVITDNTELAGISFAENWINGAQYYETAIDNPIPYGTGVYDNDFNSIPLAPNMDLLFSELGAPSDSPDNFVEIYNAGTSTVDFDQYYPYYFSIDGSSSIQLTGTIAPGGTQVIDITGTPGTSEFLLSIYGDYVDGTPIDYYDGGLAGFDFTGKHAVRHYDIVSPNLTPDLSEWVISPAEDIDMTPGSHRADLTWNGSSDAAWRNQANWAEGFIPDAGHNVFIPNAGETIPVISNGENAYCNDLTIDAGAGPGLIIQSDATNGDGSIITYGAVTGMASVQRFLGADRYWYVTQPVTSAVANVFLHMWMFTYDETIGDWGAFVEPEATPLVPMQGYAVWTSSINPWNGGLDPVGDTTTAYDGILNTGDISKALTYTSLGSIWGDGWNFVGNPYPSAVDWDAVGWTKTNLATDAYYVWNGATYATYIAGGPGTLGATQFIPAAQGFFVQTGAAGTLGVSNAVRAHSTQDFWKTQDNMLNLLSLTVSNGEVNDETVIYFNEGATADLDYSFDARKLMAVGAPQVFTMMGTDKMAINTFNNTTQTPTVTMGVNAPAAGEYTITASNLESFDASTPIYLEDLLTGQKINLREVSSYAFTAGEGTSERFVVHFTEYQGIGDNPVSEINSIYAVNRTVYVDFNAVRGEIAIYNILGQEISRSAAKNGLNMISVPQGNAVYIVKVISDNKTVTKKVFVK